MRRSIGVILVAVMLLTACSPGIEEQWQEQYDLGVRYLSEGNYEEAVIAFTAAIEIDPKRPEGYIGRGDAYTLSGDTEDNLSAALSDYEDAIALDDTLADAWLGMADVYIRQGDYDKALEILREGLEKTGNDQRIIDKITEMEHGSFTDSSGNLRRINWYGEGGALTCYYTYTYDSQGRPASVTSFDGAGNQLGYIENVYDQAGNLLSGEGLSSSHGLLQLGEYEYDAAGNRIKAVYHVSDTIDSAVGRYCLYTYDNDGNTTRQEYYEGTGEMISYDVFKYVDGLLSRENSYTPDGTLTSYYLYEYNGDGQLSKRSDYGADGTLIYYYIYSYDEDGNFSSYTSFQGDGTPITAAVSG